MVKNYMLSNQASLLFLMKQMFECNILESKLVNYEFPFSILLFSRDLLKFCLGVYKVKFLFSYNMALCFIYEFSPSAPVVEEKKKEESEEEESDDDMGMGLFG